MSYQDKQITCSDCGTTFTFGVRDQEFFASKGFTNEPKRCPSCRAAKKQSTGGGYGSSAPRQMYPVKCATCGKDTEVPFAPRGDKPVYCSDCYRISYPIKKY